jgi:hypothetical protein
MENQHRKISGYRELTQEEIDNMNQIKNTAKLVGGMIDDLENVHGIDKRWLAIAKTDLQKGFMAATRAIAQPDFF